MSRELVGSQASAYGQQMALHTTTEPESLAPPALKVQTRHDAIVKTVLKEGSFGLMILGGDHDLSENVRRLGGGRCEYVRVTMKRFEQAARE